MNQQNINRQDEFQPVAEEVFFEEATVQTIPAVIPLDETPTRASTRFRKLRVPMRKPDKSFNPAFLIMALLAVTALGVIAGTLVYRTSMEKSANNAGLETDDPVNRTIPAQYQFVVDKPESPDSKNNLSKDNLTSLPSTTAAPVKKDSRNKQDESSVPEAEDEEQTAQNEEAVKETEAPTDEDEPPPPPPLRRDRKEDKKQDKAKQKNNNDKPETQESEEPPVANQDSEQSEEN